MESWKSHGIRKMFFQAWKVFGFLLMLVMESHGIKIVPNSNPVLGTSTSYTCVNSFSVTATVSSVQLKVSTTILVPSVPLENVFFLKSWIV